MNRQLIEAALNEWGMKVGGYNETLELLNKRQLQRVIEKAEYGSGDVEVVLNNKRYVVEIFHVDNEIDFGIITKSQYVKQYGMNK